MRDITSRPYRPTMACEACAFSGKSHAMWCPEISICECEDATLCGCGSSMNGAPHCMFCLRTLRPETTARWSDFLRSEEEETKESQG